MKNHPTSYIIAFCSRNLYFEERPESYYVDPSTVSLVKNKISFILKTAIANENLKDMAVKIYILKNGMFRMKLRDIEKQRFHFKKSDETFNMKTMAKLKNFKFVNQTQTKFSVYYFDKAKKNTFFIEIDNTKKTKYELVVEYNPFGVYYSIDNKEVIVINSKNLLNMEVPTEKNIKTEEEAMSSVKVDVKYKDCILIWGLPERAGDMLLSDTKGDNAYRLFNVDKFKFSKEQTFGLYGAWPFIMAYQQGGEVYSGFLWNNPSETYVGIQSQEGNKDVLWISEKGVIDFTFFADSNIFNFYYKYQKYIGFAPLPPAFALGYHQSRYSYKNTADVVSVDKKFDDYDIPYDSIWLDIDHTDEKRYMTWNSNFEDIEDFAEQLEEKGRNLVVIIDPHIKVDYRYFLYSQALRMKGLIKEAPDENYPGVVKETPFVGKCWCDEASYLDFYNPKVRNFWLELLSAPSSQYNYFPETTNVHIWNDMNEPSVFDQPDVTLPRMTMFEYYDNFYEHRDAHNAYGYLMHKTTYEAMKKKYKKRPFVLTRSFYIGSHRYAAVWTGDTRSRFEDLELSIPMIINNSITGFSFVGADVGGFADDADFHLLERWYQFGVFNPFFRAHSHMDTCRREPWLYDELTTDIIRDSIIARYKLLPYLYFTFFQYHSSGLPMLRPLWFRYHNKFTLDVYANKQFFFGDALMVRPVLSEEEHYSSTLSVYLPEDDRWYSFYDYKEYLTRGETQVKVNNRRIGAFIRGGSIIPMKWRIRRSTKLMRLEPLTLIVALGHDSSAGGMVYIDDEESFDYEETKKHSLKKFMFQKNELFIANLHDEFKIPNKIERILILGIKSKVKNVYYETFLEGGRSNLEYEVTDDGENTVLFIKRLDIPLDSLWKIKLDYLEE